MLREAIIGAAVLLMICQAAVIVGLLAHGARYRGSEARNNAILRALPDLMFVQTRDGVFVDYSARDEHALLASPAAFIGRRMRDVLPPELADLLDEKFKRLFAGEEPVLFDYEVTLAAGEVRQYEARLVRCESDKVLSIVRDVTAQKRAAAELRAAQAELFRTSKLATLGEFAGSIAHELAQPLAAIIANSHASLRLLDRGEKELAEVRQSLYDVLESSSVAREVIERTRMLFGHGAPEQTPLDLTDTVIDVCRMVSPTLQERRVALDVRLDIGHRTVRGDRVQLRQVILNLISNGIQAMEETDEQSPRHLMIGACVNASGAAQVTVSDSGIGLGNVDRQRLFSAAYTTKPDGMGWGLSISRSIVEAHGGRLWAEPNDAGGATFAFTIPLEGERERVLV